MEEEVLHVDDDEGGEGRGDEDVGVRWAPGGLYPQGAAGWRLVVTVAVAAPGEIVRPCGLVVDPLIPRGAKGESAIGGHDGSQR